VVAKVVPASVVCANPLTNGERVEGVYVADTNTLEEAEVRALVINPFGLYLTTKQSKVPPTFESVAPTVPPVLYIVTAPAYCPVTTTLPDGSVVIPNPVSVLALAICAAHRTVPADEYLATKQSEFPIRLSVAPIPPPVL
jgi:hypothetical protein